MTNEPLSPDCFSITPSQSLSFAAMSGDYNPLHVDPVVAEASQFGATLIHGLHGTLQALDSFLATRQDPLSLASLEVVFNKPVRHDEKIVCKFDRVTSTSARIEMQCEGRKMQTIAVTFLPGVPHPRASLPPCPVPDHETPPKPRDINMDDADGHSGSVPLVWNPPLFAQFFPLLAQRLPDTQCATILAASTIVGMRCPGLNAIFARCKLSFSAAANGEASTLDYQVTSTDPRFSRVAMAISNHIASGEIETFIRAATVLP